MNGKLVVPEAKQAMENLKKGAPKTFLDAIELIYIFFICSEYVEQYQARSLGNGLDNTLVKFYENDITSGKFTQDEIKSFIDSRYTDNMMCVGMVAEHFDLTPNYLSAKFKKVLGIGISEYVTQCRINKAKELFNDEKLTLDDISGIVGFSNTSVFNRAFKKLEGVSPGQYRKTQKQNE